MITLKRAGIFATPILILGIIAIVWLQVLKPLFLDFAIRQIPKINESQNYVNIKVDKFDVSVLKLQLLADSVSVQFNHELNLPPIYINDLSAQIDLFDLIVGQVNLSKLVINKIKWSYEITLDKTSEKIKIPSELIFKYLSIVPIHQIIVTNSEINLKTRMPDLGFDINIPQLNISNRKKELRVSAEQLSAEISDSKNEAIYTETNISFVLSKNDLKINDFEISALNSKLSLSGEFQNIENLLFAPIGNLKIESNLNLQDLRSYSLIVFPQKKRVPAISGTISVAGSIQLATLEKIEGFVDLNTSQVVIDQFKLGQAQARAQLKNDLITVSEAKVEHPSGNVTVKNMKIESKFPYSFSAQLEILQFDLQKLFTSFSMNNIPAGLSAYGKASCNGVFNSQFSMDCTANAAVDDIWVRPSMTDSFHIVKLKNGKLDGKLKLTKDYFSYLTDIQLGQSLGKSSGIVDFEKGFDINFESDRLEFNDVESLADLDFKGQLKIKGSTQGDSNSGVINADITLNQTEISKFQLGQLNSSLEYKNLNLKFKNITGTIGKSEIGGFLNFNFDQTGVEGHLTSNMIFAEDVFFSLKDRLSIPFQFTGNGKASVVFNGPLNFWKLKYDLNSNFNTGTIANESFTKLNFNLTSNGDTILLKHVDLKKTKSFTQLEGTINTKTNEPLFDIKVKSNPFLLEEIDHLIQYAPSVSGIGYAEGSIIGPISSPKIDTSFTLKQVSYDKIEYPNSQGQISIDPDYLKFSGQLFGRQIQSDLLWPWNQKDKMSIKILVNDLNPLFLLPLVSIPQPSSEFSSKLNAEVNLTSHNRSFRSADGYVKISDFNIQRGTQFLKLQKPSRINFSSGLTHMEPIVMRGDDSFLNIELTQITSNRLKFNILSDLQLRLLQFLVPFSHTLSGNLVIKSQIHLNENSFEMLGEGELTDAYVILKGFPQAIENINTPIEFSKSNIFLNDITGKLGQSDVTGFGRIELLGPKNIQVNMKAVADNLELNFPDKILTGGKASVLFSGNWLPYNIKVDYAISHGLVQKDFETDAGQNLSLRASPYLPPKQIEELAPSLALNINVDASKGIIIKNKLIEGEASGILNISGSPEIPVIKGKIDIKPGSKLIFKDKPFAVQTAQINFQTLNEINPDLYISANSRISDYDINLIVQGPSKNPIIKPTSQPPLSEPDIFSLLALGVTSQSDQQLSSETQQKQTGLEVLAAISNQSQLNKKIQDKLGLTVQLAPSIDSTKNIAVPKVVVSKKISDKFNASYSKPFTGNDQNQEIKLQYLYNSNVSFLLNYQNKDATQEDQISNTNTKGIWGLDLEYRDEFK